MQNMVKKSKEKRAAAPNRVAAGKRASWPLSPTKEKGFEGFVGFVNKQLNSSTINNSTI